METIDRVQGTDGVRGKIAENRDFKDISPFQLFAESALITPAFCEHYAYAHACLLISSKMAEKNDGVVVGWDPRDSEGVFIQAALDGVRKAGLKAIIAGALPTPAIPLYALFLKASGGVVLTASHNPSDQNGIKLFHGFSGLKFLPEDDQLLTEKLRQQQSLNLSELPLKGGLEDHFAKAERFFVDFCLDPLNSWIDKEDFSDAILVVDASKGAAAGVAGKIFSAFSFKEVIFANLKGKINENCGVADIEGLSSISYEQVMTEGAPFYSYEALTTMFRISRESGQVKNGVVKLIGLTLDGDGDRCFRLDYHPAEDRLIVSSGDALGICQAEYLSRRPDFSPGKSLFINTVESDLNTSAAARKLGCRTETTGVGDKWILLRATLDMIERQIKRDPQAGAPLRDYLLEHKKMSDISGFELSRLWKNYLKARPFKPSESDFYFKLGVEESGHCVTPGYFRADGQLNRCLIGNGIKSGLNSLAAFESNYKNRKSSQDRLEYLSRPFNPGIKETFYVYYVDKSRLLAGSRFREDLTAFARGEFKKTAPPGFSAVLTEFGEEKDMPYWRIMKESDVWGAMFIRNSGTEDKAALYLRGRRAVYHFLRPLADALHLYLLSGLKDIDRPLAQAELKILSAVQAGRSPDSAEREYGGLPFQRLLKEMEMKEYLIERRGNKFQPTETGALFLERMGQKGRGRSW